MRAETTLVGVVTFLVGLALGVAVGPAVQDGRLLKDVDREAVQAACNRWADKLDRQTTDTGVYVRWAGEELPENDAWGRPLKVAYSQGGLAETVEVRSLGPDGESHTTDDVVVSRVSANLKGVGTGVQRGAEETSAGAARGAVKGTVQGVKESLGIGSKAEPK